MSSDLGCVALAAVAVMVGCSSTPQSTGSTVVSSLADTSCQPGATLVGGQYDISKSKFAFGSAPVAVDAGSFIRWVASDGVVAIFTDGSELGLLNADAPDANLPDWSADDAALGAHTVAYFESMGVAPCQVAGSVAFESASASAGADRGPVTVTAGPTSSVLERAVDAIPVPDSIANARFDINDQTTQEAMDWPQIPAAVVTAARTLRDELAVPASLATYKAKLPANAQGLGKVVIHHTNAGTTAPFQAVATYDVVAAATEAGFAENLSFDANGNAVTLP